MKRMISILLAFAFAFAVCSTAFAIIQRNTTVITKTGVRKVIIVKRYYYYPKKTVVIAKRTVVYRPWKWNARIRIMVANAVLRAYPHPKAAALVSIQKDREFDTGKRVESWYLIKVDGKEGWVHRDAAKIIKEEKNVKPGLFEKLEEVTAEAK
jgi:SH3-like domain-containing protein